MSDTNRYASLGVWFPSLRLGHLVWATTFGPMRVSEIWRFPVKSMGGETLLEADVGAVGIVGDRGWGVFDVETGTTLTARRAPEMLFASARVIGGEVVVELPDGQRVGEGDDALLSAWLGRDVELRPAGDECGIYEAPLDFEHDADWVSWNGPGDALHDSPRARVSLVSTSSLGSWDRRRFRTNVVVDGAGEDEFVGRTVTIGGVSIGGSIGGVSRPASGAQAVQLEVVKQIDRCVMVTRPQPGLERDLDVLRTINAERDTFLAVGCVVVAEGQIALGAEVR